MFQLLACQIWGYFLAAWAQARSPHQLGWQTSVNKGQFLPAAGVQVLLGMLPVLRRPSQPIPVPPQTSGTP